VKRQRDLLEAARALAERSPPIHVAFVGLGPELEAFEAEVRGERGISVIPRVHDMAAFYREIDLFVLCSIEEAAPLVLLEAMACARASVTTDAGSMVEILAAHGPVPCGRIVPQRQPEALARAIGELAADEHARRELGLRARARAVSEYSEEREWADYVRLYRGEGP
jgi:glycosyltransferase involved in cell wall biosynthesis